MHMIYSTWNSFFFHNTTLCIVNLEKKCKIKRKKSMIEFEFTINYFSRYKFTSTIVFIKKLVLQAKLILWMPCLIYFSQHHIYLVEWKYHPFPKSSGQFWSVNQGWLVHKVSHQNTSLVLHDLAFNRLIGDEQQYLHLNELSTYL